MNALDITIEATAWFYATVYVGCAAGGLAPRSWAEGDCYPALQGILIFLQNEHSPSMVLERLRATDPRRPRARCMQGRRPRCAC